MTRLEGRHMASGQLSSSATFGRARPRQAGSDRRAPLAATLSRASKRTRGRAETSSLTAHIRVLGVELDPADRQYIRRKLGMKLGKFASSLERVSVRVKDVNGPRGGVDHACSVKVVMSGLSSIVVVERDASLAAAIDRAIGGAEPSVRRAVQRRRMGGRTGGRARLPD
jgi:ribosome-associated translation inhibitor RaiA